MGGNGRAGIPTQAFVLQILELSTIPHGMEAYGCAVTLWEVAECSLHALGTAISRLCTATGGQR